MRRYLAPIQTKVAALKEQSARALSKSRDSEAERRRAVERAKTAETQLAGLQCQLAALETAGLDTAELRLSPAWTARRSCNASSAANG